MRAARVLAFAAALVWSLLASPLASASDGASAHGRSPVQHGHSKATESQGEGHGEAQGGGAHGGHEGFSVGTFALQLVNFGCLLFILIYFGGRAMNKSLRSRHEQLKNEIGEASRLRDEAKAKAQAVEGRLAALEGEVQALRENLRLEAEREQARVMAAAQERGKQIQDDVRLQIDEQVREAEAILRAEVANAAITLADSLVRKNVGDDDHRRLAQEFVAGSGKEAR